MWGLIAFGLLVLFIFVGYEAAMKLRSPITANTPNASSQTDGNLSVSPSGNDTVARTIQDQKNSGSDFGPSEIGSDSPNSCEAPPTNINMRRQSDMDSRYTTADTPVLMT